MSGHDGSVTVSVIVAAYNVAQYIAAALDSILDQTFSGYEIIVINDGSPDTPELERVLQPYLGRIRYVVQENQGFAGALNTGIDLARGRYIALLGPDDYWEKDLLASQLSLIESGPQIGAVYADARMFGDPKTEGKRYMEVFPSNGDVTLEALLDLRCNVIGSTTVIRTEVLKTLGGFDSSLRSSEDFDLWLRIVQAGWRIVYQKRVLAHYRRRPGSLMSDGTRHEAFVVQVLTKLKNTGQLSPSETEKTNRMIAAAESKHAWHLGRRALISGDYLEACRQWRAANRFYRQTSTALLVGILSCAPGLFGPMYRRILTSR